jgi:hypothetical protein
VNIDEQERVRTLRKLIVELRWADGTECESAATTRRAARGLCSTRGRNTA